MKALLSKILNTPPGMPWIWTLYFKNRAWTSDRSFRTREQAWKDLRQILEADKIEIETWIQ